MKNSIEVYREKHGSKYDYSLSDFNNLKIKIICPSHGIFEQNKYSHKKYGCWKCSVEFRSEAQRMGNVEFENKSKLIHGDKYDYSIVDYINNNTKVIINCNKHGQFKQTPSSHLMGNGCPKCGTESAANLQSDTNESFIEKSLKTHGGKYDYSKVNYISQKNKVKIICKEHGIFEQYPNNHLRGANCPKCLGRLLTNSEFLDKCKEVHGDKYDYSLVDYKNTFHKIKIICKNHGIFNQNPNNHLNQKQGCPKCGGVFPSNTLKFIGNSKKIHGDRYDYSLVDYKKAKSPVVIICNKHGKFNQAPTHHLSGQGCPICKSSKGENEIFKILTEKNIRFEHHLKLENSKLEFDFYLPELNVAIEYDGVQHFKPVNHFGGISTFKDQQRRDGEKDKYCIDNGIKLIRIPYTEKVDLFLEMNLFY